VFCGANMPSRQLVVVLSTLSDGLERCCYQAVLVAAAIIMFQRIAFAQDVVTLVQECYGTLQEFTVFQLRTFCRVALLVGCAWSICCHWVSNIPWKPNKQRDFVVLMCATMYLVFVFSVASCARQPKLSSAFRK
jgi:hypothetical protein